MSLPDFMSLLDEPDIVPEEPDVLPEPDFMSLLDEPDIVPEEPGVLPEPDFMSLDDEPAPVPELVAGDVPEVLAEGEAPLFVSVPVLDGELPLLSPLDPAPAPDDDPPAAPDPEPPALPAPAP